jgi:flagellar motor switch protein FliN/FliY
MTRSSTISRTSSPADVAIEQHAADALAAHLPGAARPRATRLDGILPADATPARAVIATFVGTRAADIALIFIDTEVLSAAAGVESALVDATDVLRPALEEATSVLGIGVLGEVTTGDATAIFAAGEAAIFELTTAAGPAGWFAIRLRDDVASTHDNGAMASNLGRISNVEMSLTVEIGRTRMSVRELLSLEPGAVIELDRSVGTPADVLLNGRLIARGEIVVVDQEYAVRITRILDTIEATH